LTQPLKTPVVTRKWKLCVIAATNRRITMIGLQCLIDPDVEGIRHRISNTHRDHCGVHCVESVDPPSHGTCRWEVAATLNIALQGAALFFMSPFGWKTIGRALRALSGVCNLEDYIGHDCYVVARRRSSTTPSACLRRPHYGVAVQAARRVPSHAVHPAPTRDVHRGNAASSSRWADMASASKVRTYFC
jgi:hypothetical protein